ncbi:hypothetical protein TNCV_584691 [Trichonephila clavipes]|nr:hypothetical protein TNCV_584691 [Trichonephila clavipes]
MLIQPTSSQPGFVRGKFVLLDTVWITEPHTWMEVITSNSTYRIALREVGTRTKDIKQCHEKIPQTIIEPPCPCTVPTWHARSMAE